MFSTICPGPYFQLLTVAIQLRRGLTFIVLPEHVGAEDRDANDNATMIALPIVGSGEHFFDLRVGLSIHIL